MCAHYIHIALRDRPCHVWSLVRSSTSPTHLATTLPFTTPSVIHPFLRIRARCRLCSPVRLPTPWCLSFVVCVCHFVHSRLHCISSAAVCRPTCSVAMSSVTSPVVVRFAQLPHYREQILTAIRANPGRKSRGLSDVLLRDCGVAVHFDTLRTYIQREQLHAVDAAVPQQ